MNYEIIQRNKNTRFRILGVVYNLGVSAHFVQIPLIKFIKFICFIVYLLLKSYKINYKTYKFNKFLNEIFRQTMSWYL